MERFYGLEVPAGKDAGAAIDAGHVLHVSQIALPGPDGGKSTVYVTVDGKKLCVGTLDGKAHVYHIAVDLLFSAEQQVRFTAVGRSGVHITGYTQAFSDADSMGDSADEDESDGDLEDGDWDVDAKGDAVRAKDGGMTKVMGGGVRGSKPPLGVFPGGDGGKKARTVNAGEASVGGGHAGKGTKGSLTKPAAAPHVGDATSDTDGVAEEDEDEDTDGDDDDSGIDDDSSDNDELDEDGDSDEEAGAEQRPAKQRHVERGGGRGRGFDRHRGGGGGDRGGFHRGGVEAAVGIAVGFIVEAAVDRGGDRGGGGGRGHRGGDRGGRH